MTLRSAGGFANSGPGGGTATDGIVARVDEDDAKDVDADAAQPVSTHGSNTAPEASPADSSARRPMCHCPSDGARSW